MADCCSSFYNTSTGSHTAQDKSPSQQSPSPGPTARAPRSFLRAARPPYDGETSMAQYTASGPDSKQRCKQSTQLSNVHPAHPTAFSPSRSRRSASTATPICTSKPRTTIRAGFSASFSANASASSASTAGARCGRKSTRPSRGPPPSGTRPCWRARPETSSPNASFPHFPQTTATTRRRRRRP